MAAVAYAVNRWLEVWVSPDVAADHLLVLRSVDNGGEPVMLSWEDQKGSIARQELAFMGLVVLFKTGKPVLDVEIR